LETVYRISNTSSNPKELSSTPSILTIVSDVGPLLPGIIETEKGPHKKVQAQNIYIRDSGVEESSYETSHPFPKTVKYPKVRLFLCGSEAERCANMVLKHSVLSTVKMVNGYGHMDFSMTSDCFSNIVLSRACSNLFWSNSLHSYVCGSSNAPSGGKGMSASLQCKSCSSDLKYGSVINIEMHVILDDKLFHNCCSFLFTKSSMFVLTFDAAKLLESHQAEFARLQNFAHTIRSFPGDDCPVTIYGILNGGPTHSPNIIDEVQSLFYINNSLCRQYNVSGPELFTSCQGGIEEGTGKHQDSRGLQVFLPGFCVLCVYYQFYSLDNLFHVFRG